MKKYIKIALASILATGLLAMAFCMAQQSDEPCIEPEPEITVTYTQLEAETEHQEEPALYTDEELDILARLAWAEARGEDDVGIIMVIHVVLNRMNSPQFPDTIRDVVFQHRHNANGSITWQFSPIGNGAFDRATPCERIESLVVRALVEDDTTAGALFFRMTRGAEGSWHERALTRLFTHGTHHFYK